MLGGPLRDLRPHELIRVVDERRHDVGASVDERQQAGRTVYRVRIGPFERREDAENAKEKLGDSGVDSALVAVQK